MEAQNIKEKILSVLKIKGPNFPVPISKEIQQTSLLTSAFLSELVYDKKIKMSNMRIGSSPIYFIQGQEEKLENFSEHLKSKEKEAFNLLKQKKFLKDSIQEPAIRVALREIKDFAIPFKKENEIYWKYFTASENEFENKQKEIKEEKSEENSENEIKFNIEIKETAEQKEEKPEQEIEKIKEPQKEIKEKKSELNIFDKPIKKTTIKKKKTTIKKTSQKRNDKFFNKVKEFLSKKQIEILDIEGFSKNDILFRVKVQGQEKLLVAYNKKRIKEEDVIQAYKKADELNLKYIILSFGEPLKKLNNLIQAIKNLSKIEKIQE